MSYPLLLATISAIIVPTLIGWATILIKIAKLEARADAKDEHLERIESKLDKLITLK